MQIIELVSKIGDLVIALNEYPLNKHDGAWTHQVDDQWFIAANGHKEEVRVPDTKERMGFTVQPFEFAAWYNGWLAGSFNAFGGIIAGGDGANEETLLAELNAKIERIKEQAR